MNNPTSPEISVVIVTPDNYYHPQHNTLSEKTDRDRANGGGYRSPIG